MRLETASERNEVKIMALKKLNQFNYFDAEGFFSKLKLITVGSTVWKEYGSNVVKGTKLEVVIASDKHRYNNKLKYLEIRSINSADGVLSPRSILPTVLVLNPIAAARSSW